MVMEGDLTWDGENTVQHTPDVLQNCIPETYIILLTNVTPIDSINKKELQKRKTDSSNIHSKLLRDPYETIVYYKEHLSYLWRLGGEGFPEKVTSLVSGKDNHKVAKERSVSEKGNPECRIKSMAFSGLSKQFSLA